MRVRARGRGFLHQAGNGEELRRYGEGIFFSSENRWVGGKQMERNDEDVRKGFGGKRKERCGKLTDSNRMRKRRKVKRKKEVEGKSIYK